MKSPNIEILKIIGHYRTNLAPQYTELLLLVNQVEAILATGKDFLSNEAIDNIGGPLAELDGFYGGRKGPSPTPVEQAHIFELLKDIEEALEPPSGS